MRVGVKTQGGAHVRVHGMLKMWGFPAVEDPEGVDEGRAAGRGHPERVEPEDMGPHEMGL